MVLEDEADVGVAEAGLFGFLEFPGLDAVEGDLAGGGRVEQAKDLEERALAAAGGAHDGKGVPEAEVQVDVFEDRTGPAADLGLRYPARL